jgi:hypothetical protein
MQGGGQAPPALSRERIKDFKKETKGLLTDKVKKRSRYASPYEKDF